MVSGMLRTLGCGCNRQERTCYAAGFEVRKLWGDYGPRFYQSRFPEDSIRAKAFYNIGSGKWRHPIWTNVDYSSEYYGYDESLIDLEWDIASLRPVPIADETAELVYSSHTVEHLLDGQVDFLLGEIARILKPGGVLRITTPNIRLYYLAYKRRDVHFNHHYGSKLQFGQGETFTRDRLSIWLVNEFATQLVQSVCDGHVPRFQDPKELDALLASGTMEDTFARLSAMIDFDLQRKAPCHHVSWWTNEKLCAAMKRAGFSETVVSVRGGSISPAMRDLRYFDAVIPTCSLFVDAIK